MIVPDLGHQTVYDPTPDPGPAPAGSDAATQSFGADAAPGRLEPSAGGAGLRFSRPDGPVVVICGLHGGAGTSTLAYALAAQAAEESPAPVLLCETDAAAGDVAALAGVTSPLSLTELAVEFADGRAPERGTLARRGKLRVIAHGPADVPTVADGAVAALLTAARRRHGLTVIDAGTARAPSTRELLQIATHVVWVTLARPGAGTRARALLSGRLLPPLGGRQALVVRGVRRTRGVGVHQQAAELHQVAEDCCERLVLMGDSPGVSGTHVELGERRMLAALTALSGFLEDPGHSS